MPAGVMYNGTHKDLGERMVQAKWNFIRPQIFVQTTKGARRNTEDIQSWVEVSTDKWLEFSHRNHVRDEAEISASK